MIAFPAFAQLPPTAPTREEIERVVPERTAPAPARLSVEGDIERAPCALDRPEYADIRLTLTDAVFDDLKGLPAEALRPAFADELGRDNPIAIVCAIRDRAAAILREAGYIAAVEVPEQRITGGIIHFRVVMARLVGLRVRGDAGHNEGQIARYLQPLTEREVFNRYEAERALLLAGDMPGYNVRLALRSAGQARGEVIGEVLVSHTPVLVDATVQNLGSRELGRWGMLLRAQFFGLTGLGDRTTLAAFTTADTSEQQTLLVAHDFRLGGSGLAIGGQLTYSWARPDLGDPLIDIDSRTLFATLEANYPLVRRQSRTVRAAAGMDIIDQDVDFGGAPLSRDHLRVGFARLTADLLGLVAGDPRYTPAEPRWRLSAAAELRQGFDLLGASEGCGPLLAACFAPGAVPPTRFEGNPTATVVRGNVLAEFRPMPMIAFALSARGQYSAHPLFSFEEFSAGNYSEGRGYDPGALLGDSGIGLQAELRFGSPYPRGPDEFRAEAFLFFDQAWVWNQDQILNFGRQELSSLGGGVRAAFGDRFRLEILVAAPLDALAGQPNAGNPRLLINFTTRLWPWRSR
ncbi:MAG TPA: ShlB/FhaC/HecB family hemolysin secretion/activation protein [Allosphingosinicella sp.]